MTTLLLILAGLGLIIIGALLALWFCTSAAKMGIARGLRLAVVFAVVTLATGCASIGSGRADVVRAEDTLVNSLTVYEAVMELHYAVSAHEPPEVYAAVEEVRKTFPPAYRVAKSAVRAYKAGRSKDFGTALDELEDALDKLRDLLPRLRTVKK